MEPARLLAQCPLCQTVYADQEIHLLGEQDSAKLFHCTCRACGHAMIAVVLESAGLVSSIGMLTDLEVHDALRCQSATSLTTDECIQGHQIFHDEGQKFCEWLMASSARSAHSAIP